MATTTTNFGWDIPQSTDLVKDGATAIAALGQDIDTAFIDLKGGTTGQVLAKASGTDLDFSWVAQDDSNAIQNAIVDAKGDLITATAADTPARLAVGTNGQVLTADSTASTGLAWATASSGGKTLLSTTSLSGASTVISGISGSYTDLEMVIYGVSVSTSAQVYFKPNGSSTVRWVVARAYGTTPTKDVDAISTSASEISPTAGQNYLASNTNNGFALKINNYASTAISYKPFRWYGQAQSNANTSSVVVATGGGAINDATAISSMTVGVYSGTFTGTLLIYGVK